jgi:hypothetical protein
MTFKNLFIEHERTAEEQVWIEEEIVDQEARFEKVAQEMRDLAPQREVWYQEFFDRITTIGFNVDNDEKLVIKPEELPVKPEGREDKVVWKYGIDGE